MPMKPIPTPPTRLIAVPGNRVGREILEAGARERLDRAGLAVGMFGAAARLHPLQLGRTLVELVIADRGQLEAGHAQRLDRRLVEEQGGADRACADQVAGRDGDAVGGTDLLQRAGQIGRPSGRDRAVWGRHRQVGRLEIAVEVVDGKDLHLDWAGRDRSRARRRCAGR
jgi:hypothetical protein